MQNYKKASRDSVQSEASHLKNQMATVAGSTKGPTIGTQSDNLVGTGDTPTLSMLAAGSDR